MTKAQGKRICAMLTERDKMTTKLNRLCARMSKSKNIPGGESLFDTLSVEADILEEKLKELQDDIERYVKPERWVG
jgi:hypothetical protein